MLPRPAGLASERARIEAAGGCVVGGDDEDNPRATARVDGLIAVSRAFGDFFFAGRIVPMPFTSVTPVKEVSSAPHLSPPPVACVVFLPTDSSPDRDGGVHARGTEDRRTEGTRGG